MRESITIFFYDEQRYLNDKNKLINKVMSIENNMFEDGIIFKDRKYFVIDNEKCEMYRSSDAFKSELKHSGFFVIMTNHYKCSEELIERYHNKDVVEKSFDNLKNDLDLKRLRIHSDKAMEGRIFIGFIGLILMSFIREKMRLHNFLKSRINYIYEDKIS